MIFIIDYIIRLFEHNIIEGRILVLSMHSLFPIFFFYKHTQFILFCLFNLKLLCCVEFCHYWHESAHILCIYPELPPLSPPHSVDIINFSFEITQLVQSKLFDISPIFYVQCSRYYLVSYFHLSWSKSLFYQLYICVTPLSYGVVVAALQFIYMCIQPTFGKVTANSSIHS